MSAPVDLLPLYGAGGPLRLLNRSENEIWAAGDLVLRLHRPGYHSRAEIASELAWLKALQGVAGLRAVRPVATRDGALIVERGGRRSVGFARIDGQHPAPGEDLARWMPEIGRIAALLHDHAQQWTVPEGFTRKHWDAAACIGPEAIWGDWRKAAGLDEDGRAVLARAEADINARLSDYPGSFGLIHGDLRLGNLLVGPEGLHILDFDDCGMGWQMFDFAASLSFIETDPRLARYAALWVGGYRSARAISEADIAILPVMVMMRRIQLTAWLTSRAGNDTWTEFGGPGFARDTVTLARAYLARSGWWGGVEA